MNRLALKALSLILITAPVFAQPATGLSGNDALARCTTTSELASPAYCLGYLQGASFMLEVMLRTHNLPGCIPPNATAAQLKDVFVKYLEDHPNIRHEPESVLFVMAVADSWACQFPQSAPQSTVDVTVKERPNYPAGNFLDFLCRVGIKKTGC